MSVSLLDPDCKCDSAKKAAKIGRRSPHGQNRRYSMIYRCLGLRWGIFFIAGQVCSAMSRVIVCRSRHAELLERSAKIITNLRLDDGINLPEFGANVGFWLWSSPDDTDETFTRQARDQAAAMRASFTRNAPYTRQSSCDNFTRRPLKTQKSTSNVRCLVSCF
jgi:hypothetical protein